MTEDISTKPYLIRALYEWCTDSGYTPYVAVAVDAHTLVPREFVRNGEIVLNISDQATHRLKIDNAFISFQARFTGMARELSIPIANVISIYARETGHGMAFEVPKALALSETEDTSPVADTEVTQEVATERPSLSVVSSEPAAETEDTPPDEPGSPTPSRPKLTRIK
jgi:stringent starvation protein B